MDWYTVHVRRGCEQATAQRLARVLRVTTYCPEVRQRGGGTSNDPLFCGYFFVQEPGSAEMLLVIDCTPGFGMLVRKPPAAGQQVPALARLPDGAIEWLRRRLADCDGAGGLPVQAQRSDGPAPIAVAPLPGLEAALSDRLTPAGRVAVLLKALGCEDEAGDDPDANDGDAAPVAKRLRRTRGHGRKIHYR